MFSRHFGPVTSHAGRIAHFLASTLFAAVLFAAPLQGMEQSDAYVLRVCNQGNVEVRIAMVRHRGGNLFGLLGGTDIAEGWWAIAPGRCEIVYDEVYGNGAWLAFTFMDHAGVWPSYGTTPEGPGVFENLSQRTLEPSTRRFCVSSGRFKYDGSPDQLARCPAGASNRYEIPFTINFSRPVLAGGSTTYTIRPDVNDQGQPIEGSPSTSAAASSPPPPAAKGVPKPLQAGTHNAMFMGKPHVRWPGGGWYDKDGNVVSDGELPYDLFDYPGKMSPQLVKQFNPHLQRMVDSVSGRVDLLYQEHIPGRLMVLTSKDVNDAIFFQTFNLQGIDIDAATYDPDEGVIEVPCKRSATCLHRWRKMNEQFSNSGFVSVFKYPVADGAGSMRAIAALRDLAALFPNTMPPVPRRDPSCSCWQFR